MPTRVAVVGGGPLGLMALKNFREDGFDATLYESRSWVGGIWKYSTDDALSTAESTVFNSSKYRAAISDFPVPDSMADFPPARELYEYIVSYCEHFNLWPHIELNSPVKKVRRQDDRWVLEIGGENARLETHDKVALSCGPFVKPRKPNFDGAEKFVGKQMHALNFQNPAQFEGQRVLLVGLHATAQDIVIGLSGHASQVYGSHRSGIILLPRYMSDGSVYDRMPPTWFTILSLYFGKFLPTFYNWMMNKLILSTMKREFPDLPDSWGFLPAPSPMVAPPLIGSELYPLMESGFCEPVPEVTRIIGPRSVELKSGRVLQDIDAIIYCTGYHTTIPVDFEPQDIQPYPYAGAVPLLYRNIFSLSPDPAIRTSIVFLGGNGIPFPGFAVHEAQNMAVSQIWQGKSHLPPLPEMRDWRKGFLRWREDTQKKYNATSTFYPLFVPMTDHIDWLDKTAGLGMRKHFGLVERWTNFAAWKFWWNERKLYHQILNGLTSCALFRLFDEGKRKPWSGAREQIFIDDERAVKQQKDRLQWLAKQKNV